MEEKKKERWAKSVAVGMPVWVGKRGSANAGWEGGHQVKGWTLQKKKRNEKMNDGNHTFKKQTEQTHNFSLPVGDGILWEGRRKKDQGRKPPHLYN